MGKIACATGHRPEKFRFKYNEADPECINLKRVLKNEILKLINHGYDYFISGMALGWDMWFAGYNGSKGGTQHTFSYAIEKGVNIIHINPDTKTIRYIKNRKDGN